MISSRLISDLDPDAATICNAQVFKCHRAGIELLITSTYRDYLAQDALYAIGRSVQPERRPVTNARAGQSWHNFRAAWDVVPLVGGKCVWDERDPLWKEVVRIGKECGAEAGADWPLFRDLPHFQFLPKLRQGVLSLAEARNRFDEHGTIFTA